MIMKQIRLLLVILLISLSQLSFSQTYFYLNNLLIAPSNPTTADAVSLSLSGNLSSTDIVVYDVYVSISGYNVNVDVSVGSTGMGLTVLVPYTSTVLLGNLPAGIYNVSFSGNYVGDYIPLNQKIFTVTEQTSNCQADFVFSPDTSLQQPLSLDVFNFFDMSSSANGIASWYWDFGDGTSSTLQNPTHGYINLMPGIYPVCLTITTLSGCTSTFCDTIFVGIIPNNCMANFTYYIDPNTVNPNILNFVDASTSTGFSISSWLWDFGDGTTSTMQNPTHTFSGQGTYNVCLTIMSYSSNGNILCTSTNCEIITIGNPQNCQADFYYYIDSTTSNPNTVNFVDMSIPANNTISWQWYFGDNTSSTLQNPVHTYSSSGPFSVCLTITAASSSGIICTSTFCDTIFVGTIPNTCIANFNYTYSSTGANVFNFIDASTSIGFPVNSWFWDFGDGAISTLQYPNHMFSAQGNYNVCLTITTANSIGIVGCTSTYCEIITVGNPQNCQADFYYYIDSTTTNPNIVNFVDLSTPANNTISWQWDFGDNTSSALQNPVHTYSGSGPFYVCLSITAASPNGIVCTSTFCDTIFVGIIPNNCMADFTYYIDPNTVNPNILNFVDASTSTGFSISSWLWDFGDGTTSTIQNPIHTFTYPGNYNVCLTIVAIDVNGNLQCSNTYCEMIAVGNSLNCQADFYYYFDSTIMNPNIVNFVDMSIPGSTIISWQWDFGDNTISTLQNPVHTFPGIGSYNVCLTIVAASPGGSSCTNTFCTVVIIGNPPICEAEYIYYPLNMPVLSMDFFQFMDMSQPASDIVSWYWDFGDGQSSTDPNPSHGYFNMIPGIYNVCLTITTVNGCSDTYCDSIFVTVVPGNCISDFGYYPETTVNCLNCYQFIDSSATMSPIISWFWDFGDGTNSLEQNPIHTFQYTGSFYVCLTITTAIGCYDTYCEYITVGSSGNCQAEFIAFTDSVFSPIPEIIPVVFVDISQSPTPIISWYWDFGDGQTSTDQNPINNYWLSNWGYNTVCLTITTADNCTSTFCETIYVGYNPCNITATFVATNVSIFGGNDGAIDLVVTGGTPPYSFQWSNNQTTEDIFNLTAGIYSVIITDIAGCVLTMSIVISEPSVNVAPWTFTITANNHTILIPEQASIIIDGNPALVGDYLGVFYDSLGTLACAGYTLWTEATTSITVWGEDVGNDGMAAAEEFKWKIWQAATGVETNAVATYETVGFPNTGYFVTNGISGIATLAATSYQSQILSFPDGWSIFSTYIIPTFPNVDSVFTSISSNVIIVKSGLGMIYWPLYNLNSIGDLAIGEGYQIKMDTSKTLEVMGVAVVPELTPLNVVAGWSIIGYLRQSAAPIADMFSPIVSEIVIAKNYLGYIYWPTYNLNSIGNMNPGEGYQIKLENAVQFSYPANTSSFSKSDVNVKNPKHFTDVLNTGHNMTLCIPLNVIEESVAFGEAFFPQIGDEIGVFTESGKLVGASVFENENTYITIWGNDDYSIETDGLIDNEKFSIKIWQNNSVEYSVMSNEKIVVIHNWIEGNNSYETNKIAIAGRMKILDFNKSNLHLQLFQNYPNPFSKSTEIRFYIPQKSYVQLIVYNILGEIVEKVVSKDMEKGYHSMIFENINLPASRYFYKLITQEGSKVKQMSIVK
jgi:PKD repeat protein